MQTFCVVDPCEEATVSESKIGEALIERAMDSERQALIAYGDFEQLFQAYLAHCRRWEDVPDHLALTAMRQGLAGAALYLSCRPRDEIVGWTISIQEPPLNLFLTGDAGTNSVTGRAFPDGVREAEANRLFVQSRRPTTGTHESAIEVDGLDVLGIFEQYYDQSEQFPARFFDYDDGRYVMAVGLPGLDEGWLHGLDRDAIADSIRSGSLTKLDTRLYRFACGCTEERLREVVRLSYQDNPDELFQDDPAVEVQCPRCGHMWDIRREDF